MTPSALATALQSATPPKLLDVRQPEEHRFACLPDSKLIPLNELTERVAELEDWKEESVVVYCHHGIRSANAIGWLRQQGFERLQNLSGGIDGWTMEVDSKVPRY
ncbi:MAG: rhodanese-like domain-containing protein [Verrucomicrobiia bacterium]|jgi:rhodanese-related sulfurtransferase